MSLFRPDSGRNLFFSTDIKKHIAEADVVFVRRVSPHCRGRWIARGTWQLHMSPAPHSTPRSLTPSSLTPLPHTA